MKVYHLAADVDSQIALCGQDAIPAILFDRQHEHREEHYCLPCIKAAVVLENEMNKAEFYLDRLRENQP